MTDSAHPRRRRSTHVGDDAVTPGMPGVSGVPGGDDPDLDQTQIGSRRSRATLIDDDHLDETQIGSRRSVAEPAGDDDLEPTDPSASRAARRARARARDHEPDDATAVSSRNRRAGLEATLKSRRKPKGASPANIDETFSLAGRRTVQILDVGTHTTTRAAFSPEQAILKAPYRPRKQTLVPVVHVARQAPARAPKPLEESMGALLRQRKAARRLVLTMAIVGGSAMLLSAGGLVVLLMLG